MTPFSEKFRHTKTATEFIGVWRKVTKQVTLANVEMAVPIEHNIEHDLDISASSQGSTLSDESSASARKHHLDEHSSSTLVPAPKRSSTIGSSENQSNPIDDRIQGKN